MAGIIGADFILTDDSLNVKKGSNTVTFTVTANDSFISANSTTTLTNKTLTSPTITGASMAGTLSGGIRSVRQTVFNGPVSAGGTPNFGGSTGSTTVTAAGTLSVTAAQRTTDYNGSITNPSWTGLSTNGTMFLYLTVNTDGTCTTGSTTLAPTYAYANSASITSGQLYFSIPAMQMFLGNGTSAVATPIVVVGEVTVASGVTTAILWYALNGVYCSADTILTSASPTLYTFNHNIGTNVGVGVRTDAVANGAIAGYSTGDTILGTLPGHNSGTYVTTCPGSAITSRLVCSYVSGASYTVSVTNKSNGQQFFSSNTTDFKIRQYAWRMW